METIETKEDIKPSAGHKVLPIVFSFFLCIMMILTFSTSRFMFVRDFYNNAALDGQQRQYNIKEFIKDFERNLSLDIFGQKMFMAIFNFLLNITNIMDGGYGNVAITDDGYAYQLQIKNGNPTNIITEKFATNTIENMQNNIIEFNDALNERGIPFKFYSAPSRVVLGETKFENKNIIDYSNENKDAFLSGVQTVPYLDMRDIPELNTMQAFYKTDHHWTGASGFLAAQIMVEEIENFLGISLDRDYYFDMSNYTTETYDDIFRGSQVHNIPENRVQSDDIELYVPKFVTDYLYTARNIPNTFVRDGNMAQALLNYAALDPKNTWNNYGAYLYGLNGGEQVIINNSATNDLKILFLGDSFGIPTVTYMSTAIKEIHYLYPVTQKNVLAYVDEISPDYVVMLTSARGVYHTIDF